MRLSTIGFKAAVGALATAGLLATGPAFAAPVVCNIDAPNDKNYMAIDDGTVTACLGAGIGNLTGNNSNDLFLTSAAGAGYVNSGKTDGGANPYGLTYTQNGSEGTFSINSSVWGDAGHVAIGFKFGTGNEPDEWFVFKLGKGVTSGDWSFFNLGGKGGGLSHMIVYTKGGIDVPEPGSLALLGLGLVGIGLARRRKARA